MPSQTELQALLLGQEGGHHLSAFKRMGCMWILTGGLGCVQQFQSVISGFGLHFS